MVWHVAHGFAADVLQGLPDNSVDVCLTDPPYGLGVQPDINAVLAAWIAGLDFEAKGGGYQNRKWDAFVPGPRTWAQVLRVLKPGALLLASSSPTTVGLLDLALRLAGFEVRDMLVWCYATGTVVSMGLPDKSGTGLKRSWEPWVLARKPCGDDTATEANRASGAGGLWVYGRDYHPANLLVDDAEWLRPGNAPKVFFQPKVYPNERDLGLAHWPWLNNEEMTGRVSGSAGVQNPRAGAGRAKPRKNPHATVKPLSLLFRFVDLLSRPGQLLLDPFCGSGTTGMAAVDGGRHFLGIDADETSARAARDRIQYVENINRR